MWTKDAIANTTKTKKKKISRSGSMNGVKILDISSSKNITSKDETANPAQIFDRIEILEIEFFKKFLSLFVSIGYSVYFFEKPDVSAKV